MANVLTSNPIILDTVGGFFAGPGSIGSISYGGNTDTDSTVLVYNVKNRLTNHHFEVWGGGTSVAPTDWTLTGSGAACAREATIVKSGPGLDLRSYSAKVTRATNDCHISQDIIGRKPCLQDGIGAIGAWAGKRYIAAGAWVYATVASRAYVETYDGQTTTTSSAHSGGSAWEWIATAAVAVHASATGVTLRLIVKTGDTSAYFMSPMLFEAIPLYSALSTGTGLPATTYQTRVRFDNILLTTLTGGTLMIEV